MRELSKQEVFDMIDGATIFGTGGGGDPSTVYDTLERLYEDGFKPKLVELSELNENDYVGSPYFVGSIAPQEDKIPNKKFDHTLIERAIKITREILNFDVKGLVASELGGGNTGVVIVVSALTGIPLINGDFMGRAGPELHQSTVNVCGKAMTPSVIITGDGNEVIVMKYSSIDSYEHLARSLSVISGGSAAVLDSILSKSEANKCYIKGTLQRCLDAGRARRIANEKGKDPIEEIIKLFSNGKIIFKGVVTKYTWKDDSGFLKGTVIVDGEGEYRGKKLENYIMNEHISSKIDGEYVVLPPDLIAFLNPESGAAITNTVLSEGMHVTVVTGTADDIWKTKKGLELFGPEHFGIFK